MEAMINRQVMLYYVYTSNQLDGVNACRVCCSSGGNSTCQAQTPTTNRSDGYQCIFQTNPIVTGTCDMVRVLCM